MGRYSSDSEEEKKKRKKKKKKRSRSRSVSVESKQSTKQKKSKKKKKKRSVSRSPDRFGRDRSRDRYKSRSRSRSYGRRSRSRSRDKYRRRSRSPSRGRYSRSRSGDRRRRRSRSYDSYSRSSRRSSRSPSRKGKRNKSKEREDPCLSIPGFSEMTPAEQAKIRMQVALKAAAAADEKIKGDNRSSSSTSLADSMAFSLALQDIESSSFSATAFKSNRADKREDKVDADTFTFGTAGELRLDTRKPVIVDVDKEDLAHPSLYVNPDEMLDKWIQRLTLLRRKKLEGEALS